jgi:hypothetical protein
LGLPTGGFDGTAAHGFARSPSCPVIHARLVFLKVCYFFGHPLGWISGWHLFQCLLELVDDFDGGLIFELLHQRLEPASIFLFVLAKERSP